MTNNYKPSGVILYSNTKVNSKFIPLFGEELGRLTSQSFLGKQFHQLHFITIFGQCRKKVGIDNRGNAIAYAQQEQLLPMKYGKYVELRIGISP